MALDDDIRTTRQRVEEALREIGVLLVALSPLDATVRATGTPRHTLLYLFIAGVVLFVVAVLLERRRGRHE